MVSVFCRICELVNPKAAATKPHGALTKLRFLMKRNPFVLTFFGPLRRYFSQAFRYVVNPSGPNFIKLTLKRTINIGSPFRPAKESSYHPSNSRSSDVKSLRRTSLKLKVHIKLPVFR
ncbi:MAG: hypothetical protein ACTS42_00800 [Candidatus Hodgkinia cicadicola]